MFGLKWFCRSGGDIMVKKGFSLVEALVVMTILAVFFAFGARIMTTKPKLKKQDTEHGYYECVYQGGHKQRYVIEGVASAVENLSQCKVAIEQNAGFFNVRLVVPTYTYKAKSGNQTLTRLTFKDMSSNKTLAKKFNSYANSKNLPYRAENYPEYAEYFWRKSGSTYHFYDLSQVTINLNDAKVYTYFTPNITDTLTLNLSAEDLSFNGEEFNFKLEQDTSMSLNDIKSYLKTTFPDSMIYNNGNLLKGVMINW